MDTVGSLVDKLATVNQKLFLSQEVLFEIRRMDYAAFKAKYLSDDEGGRALFDRLHKTVDLNLQRVALIQEVDEKVVAVAVAAARGEELHDGRMVQPQHKTFMEALAAPHKTLTEALAPPVGDPADIAPDDRYPGEDNSGSGPPFMYDCRGCNFGLKKANRSAADGCSCNSPRGINHGRVPVNTCTCPNCDPAETGSARVSIRFRTKFNEATKKR